MAVSKVKSKIAKAAKAKPAVTSARAAGIIQEGKTKMSEANQTVIDRVQSLFGDVNARTKTAIEKNSKVVAELTDLTRGNVEAAARGVEALGQEVSEYGRKSFEEASNALRSFAEVKSPVDFFRLQSEFAKSQFDSLVAESSKVSEAVIKLAGEVFEPLSSRYAVAAERVKNVVTA